MKDVEKSEPGLHRVLLLEDDKEVIKRYLGGIPSCVYINHELAVVNQVDIASNLPDAIRLWEQNNHGYNTVIADGGLMVGSGASFVQGIFPSRINEGSVVVCNSEVLRRRMLIVNHLKTFGVSVSEGDPYFVADGVCVYNHDGMGKRNVSSLVDIIMQQIMHRHSVTDFQKLYYFTNDEVELKAKNALDINPKVFGAEARRFTEKYCEEGYDLANRRKKESIVKRKARYSHSVINMEDQVFFEQTPENSPLKSKSRSGDVESGSPSSDSSNYKDDSDSEKDLMLSDGVKPNKVVQSIISCVKCCCSCLIRE